MEQTGVFQALELQRVAGSTLSHSILSTRVGQKIHACSGAFGQYYYSSLHQPPRRTQPGIIQVNGDPLVNCSISGHHVNSQISHRKTQWNHGQTESPRIYP